MSRSFEYRPEIDGLRAIAVLSVILFHGEIALPGGFLGVDVFFVISGFLISSILLQEYRQTGSISIVRFYERRARRLLPALVVTCIIVAGVAFVVMMPEDFESFLESLIAAQLFYANVHFWMDTGYFAAAAETKPLLHTWSLAVEEQYYLFFPLFLLACLRFGPRWIFGAATVTLFLGSLLLAWWGFEAMRSAAFYLTPFRVWELFAGVIAALLWARFRDLSASVRLLLSLLGLLLLFWPMFSYSRLESSAVPAMVAVVAGTTLIILFSQGTWLARLLSTGWVVMIGKISYSAYLLHQPVFTFVRLIVPAEMSMAARIVLAVVSLALGWISWRYVEKPFREKSRFNAKQIFSYSVASMVTVVALAGAAIAQGVHRPWPANVLDVSATVSAGTYGLSSRCQTDWMSSDCVTAPDPAVLLWGDSYAMHLAPGLRQQGVAFRQAALPSCPARAWPEFVEPAGDSYERQCAEFNNAVLDSLFSEIDEAQIEAVILSARDYGVRGGTLRRFPVEAEVDRDATEAQLLSTISALQEQGVRVGVVGPTPATYFDPGKCVLKTMAFNLDQRQCDFELLARADNSRLAAMVRQTGASFLEVVPTICQNDLCRTVIDDTLIFRDNGHLTPEGAKWLFRQPLARQFIEGLSIDQGLDLQADGSID